MIKEVPQWEFKERVKGFQEEMSAKGFNGVTIHSNESDSANVRYLSDYWPIFESAGIIVPNEVEPILLIGCESETFARDRSKIKKIMKLLEYRESAEPEHPGIEVYMFREVFKEALKDNKIKKLGIIGYSIMPFVIYNEQKKALPEAEIVKTDDILRKLRTIKSENEIDLLKESFRIAEVGLERVLDEIKPGMTELQVVNIAQEAMYKNGAECEGHALYVLSGNNSRYAISRPTHKRLEKGELIQLNIGARVRIAKE